METYRINKLIELRLENNQTNIYINGKLFNQCKYVLMNIPREPEIYERDYINIDELKNKYSNENENNKTLIKPEIEFFAHCSNLQAFVESGYDPSVLHSNLSVPLLKALIKLDKEVFFRLIEILDKLWIDYENEYDTRFTIERRFFLIDSYKEIMDNAIKMYGISKFEQSLSIFITQMRLIDSLQKLFRNKSKYCEVCESYQYGKELHVFDLYYVDDDIPNESVNVCENCLDLGYPYESEIAEWCKNCNRYVYVNNYDDIFYVDGFGATFCSKCFKEIVLDEGLPDFKSYTCLDEITMEQLENNGWKFVSQFEVKNDYWYEFGKSWKKLNDLFYGWKESGHEVLIFQHSHYYNHREFSLWIKKIKKVNQIKKGIKNENDN